MQPSMGPRPCSRGKLLYRPYDVLFHDGPSMGPRPCSRGKGRIVVVGLLLRTPSMGPRPCSRGKHQPDGRVRVPFATFNGAAALQPRKAPPVCSSAITPQDLQWGRGLAAAERATDRSTSRRGDTPFNGAAALQPRKDLRRDARSYSFGWPFNGAAALQPRKGACRRDGGRR